MKAANLLIDEHDVSDYFSILLFMHCFFVYVMSMGFWSKIELLLLQVVKVCDFGVARLKPTPSNAAEKYSCYSAEMTAETGTYRWMSPEVFWLQIVQIDHLEWIFKAFQVEQHQYY